eukprot:TRINITY_DN2593_c0_g1_i1.p2 TRINITY_DN2593_c0_g1~~TRINITY_DN2593_c0_g1_i1.p2  ORF type:complete len:150 (+),score=14.64 TRINITY_DN2593_c0_g1_i1:357-806(+)
MAETLRRSVIFTTKKHELSFSERKKEVDMISEENLPTIADFLVAPPPLEEAGLEDTALPPEGIQKASIVSSEIINNPHGICSWRGVSAASFVLQITKCVEPQTILCFHFARGHMIAYGLVWEPCELCGIIGQVAHHAHPAKSDPLITTT